MRIVVIKPPHPRRCNAEPRATRRGHPWRLRPRRLGATGNDQALIDAIGERMAKPDGGLLLGRRSYEDMLATWNARGGPFKDGLNATPKYVVSNNPETPRSTERRRVEAAMAAAELRTHPSQANFVFGEGELGSGRELPGKLLAEGVMVRGWRRSAPRTRSGSRSASFGEPGSEPRPDSGVRKGRNGAAYSKRTVSDRCPGVATVSESSALAGIALARAPDRTTSPAAISSP